MCMYGKSWCRFGLFEEEGVTKVSTKLNFVGIRDFLVFRGFRMSSFRSNIQK